MLPLARSVVIGANVWVVYPQRNMYITIQVEWSGGTMPRQEELFSARVRRMVAPAPPLAQERLNGYTCMLEECYLCENRTHVFK